MVIKDSIIWIPWSSEDIFFDIRQIKLLKKLLVNSLAVFLNGGISVPNTKKIELSQSWWDGEIQFLIVYAFFVLFLSFDWLETG